MWNFTVLAVRVIDATNFNINDEGYVEKAQADITTLKHDDLDIFGK